MKLIDGIRYSTAGLLLTTVLGIGLGCQQAANKEAKNKGAAPAGVAQADDATKTVKVSHDHESWWCAEHGVPEAVCGQCNAKLAAEFKRKGDWCKEHDAPDSQCFVCHPKLAEKFATEYRAKYGKEPPPREETKKNEPGKAS